MAKILLAEDEASVSAFVARALTQQGHAVTPVGNGMLALNALARESYDLLLTDIVMPELDGIALALKVAKDYPAMKILMMTGYAAERQRAHGLDALANRVIMKPFTLDEIATAVRELLAE
jgi:two-component system cell cycle response regulator CpdR